MSVSLYSAKKSLKNVKHSVYILGLDGMVSFLEEAEAFLELFRTIGCFGFRNV